MADDLDLLANIGLLQVEKRKVRQKIKEFNKYMTTPHPTGCQCAKQTDLFLNNPPDDDEKDCQACLDKKRDNKIMKDLVEELRVLSLKITFRCKKYEKDFG